jgi:hypothetical protein
MYALSQRNFLNDILNLLARSSIDNETRRIVLTYDARRTFISR